jgi:probable F420-dependent oxidoreductase
MKIGVFIFPTEYSIQMDDLGPELESRGFESLFVPEHTHIPTSRKSPFPGGGDLPREYKSTYDPFVALAFAAANTKHLKIGTGIALIPQRDPIITAKSVSSLDRMSGGRFILACGGGWNVEEMENHGASYDTRFKVLRERLLAMREIWMNEVAEFHGDFVDFDTIWQDPKPLTKPHPPILLGGETDYTLKRVVEFCSGWFPRCGRGWEPEEGLARLKRIADEAGRDMSTISTSVFRAPPEAQVLEHYDQLNIERAIFHLPSADRDVILPMLDDYAKLIT